MKDYPVETLAEFLHRITIEQQDADRYDRMQADEVRVKCSPGQDARQMVYIDMKQKGYAR